MYETYYILFLTSIRNILRVTEVSLLVESEGSSKDGAAKSRLRRLVRLALSTRD